MINTHNIYLISDSTGETLERIFMALKAQFENFDHNLFHFSFTRTENQIMKILEEAKKKKIRLSYIQLLTTNWLNFYHKRPIKKISHVLVF